MSREGVTYFDDDFEDPKLAGMICVQRTPAPESSALRHFKVELYAHRVDEKFLEVVSELLSGLAIVAREDRLHGRYLPGEIHHFS